MKKKNEVNYWGGDKPAEKIPLQKETPTKPRLKADEPIKETAVSDEPEESEPEDQKTTAEENFNIKVNKYKNKEEESEEFHHHSFSKPKSDEPNYWGKKTEL